MFPESKPLSGKRLVPGILIGFLVFTLIGLLGTFFLGNALQPYFKARFERDMKKIDQKEMKGRQ